MPSTNGAAVVLLHGAGSTRSNVLDQAAVLARHGFGVLIIDARGHGDSAGRAMDFGWHGDADVAAAPATSPTAPTSTPGASASSACRWAARRPSAPPPQPADQRRRRRGRTARNAADEAWLSDEFGVRGLLQERLERLQDMVHRRLTDASVPTSMRDAVAASGDTRYLLITAGTVADEGHAAAHIAGGAPDRVQLWTVPEATTPAASTPRQGNGDPGDRLPHHALAARTQGQRHDHRGRSQSSTHWRAQRGRGSRRWFGPAEAVPTWCHR